MFTFDDAVIRDILSRASTEESVYKSALWNAGVISIDPELSMLVGANDGRLFETHFYRDLPEPDDDENIGGPVYPDDSNNDVTTTSIDSASYKICKNGPVVSFDQKSIAKRFNYLQDPVGVVSGLLTEYWGKYLDQYAIKTFIGLIADNILSNSSDCVLVISDAATAPDATNTIQPNTIIDAEALKGDAANFNTIVMHSRVYNNLRLQNLIDFIPSSDGKVNFSLYQGKLIVVSDQVEVQTGGAFPVYTSYLMGSDVMRYGSNLGADIIGFEAYRDPRKGKGAGVDQIISRQQFALHPVGFNWLDVSVTGSVSAGAGNNIYPNWTDLQNIANWERIAASEKHIPWVAIRSNG